MTYVRILGYNPAVPFWPPVLNSVLSWSLWAFVVPFIFWTTGQLPLAQSRWRLNMFYHLLLSLAICTVISLFHTFAGAALYSWINNEEYWFAFNNFGMPEFLYLRVPWLLSVYWMALGTGYAIEYYRENNERKLREAKLESLLSETRLNALSHQLRPHFLFNTLHSVTALVNRDDKSGAIQLIERLSDLLSLLS